MANVVDACKQVLLGGRGFRRRLLTVTPVKSIDATRGVDQLLLAGEERMACRTNFHVQLALTCRTCFKGLATGAGHCYLAVFRMNSRFHFILTFI